MMTAILKDQGLDNILRHYTPSVVEEPRELVCSSAPLQAAITEYARFLDNKEIARLETHDLLERLPQFMDTVKTVLTPEEINLLPRLLPSYTDHENFRYHTGIYLSALLRNAHAHGFQRFNLDLNYNRNYSTNSNSEEESSELDGFPLLHYFCVNLEGSAHAPYYITLHGTTGGWAFYGARFVIATQYGEALAGYATKAKYSSFTVHGDAGSMFASEAYKIHSTIYGRVQYGIASRAEQCVFSLRGEVDRGMLHWLFFPGQHNIFRLPPVIDKASKENLHNLRQQISTTDRIIIDYGTRIEEYGRDPEASPLEFALPDDDGTLMRQKQDETGRIWVRFEHKDGTVEDWKLLPKEEPEE